MYIRICAYMYMYMYICIYVYMYMYICVYVCVSVRVAEIFFNIGIPEMNWRNLSWILGQDI